MAIQDFRAVLMLADYAQVADGKLFVAGGGWQFTGGLPGLAGPMGLAILIEVPWDETNRVHEVEIRLIDEDGNPVAVPQPHPEPLVVRTQFEVGRPPGIRPGMRLNVPLAVNLAPFPLQPGRSYVWRLFIDGETKDEWVVAFSVRN